MPKPGDERIQIRHESGQIEHLVSMSLDEVLESVKETDVWKVSFDYCGARIRLIRTSQGWLYENIEGERFV